MHRSFPVAAAVVAAAVFPGCIMPGNFKAEARDTWSRSYTISKTGEVSVANVNGRVDVEGTDGPTVEVVADRIARATTDQLAKELLPKIPINDRSTPDLVFIETGRINGILIGASYEVRYHVKVPRGVTVRATTVNGGVDVRSLAGRVTARTTNGGVRAQKISGALDARTVNGGIRAAFDALGRGDITLGVVNGGVNVLLPDKAKATVNATWVNGGFNSSGLQFDVRDSGKRRFEGALNGGGTSLTLNTVNGGITIGPGTGADWNKDDEADDDGGGQVKKELKGLKGAP